MQPVLTAVMVTGDADTSRQVTVATPPVVAVALAMGAGTASRDAAPSGLAAPIAPLDEEEHASNAARASAQASELKSRKGRGFRGFIVLVAALFPAQAKLDTTARLERNL